LLVIVALPAVATLAVAACSTTAPPADTGAEWVGTITTEGDVTTVINESGSVWGGKATLVEEASIGVEAGEEPYMLGSIGAVAATDERIYLLETQPAMVRVYGMDGVHLFDIGSEGQGPGEISRPMSMVIDAAGRVLVRDAGNHRMTVFSQDGELIDTWQLPGGFSTSAESVATPDGRVYVPTSMGRQPGMMRSIVGMTPYDGDGTAGEPVPPPQPDFEPASFPPIEESSEGGGRRITYLSVPFTPRPSVEMSPAGAWVLGVGDGYRFEIRRFDGTTTLVERRVEPVPVSGAEADWRRESTTKSARTRDPEWTWNGPAIPDHKPYFGSLHADQNGRVWVQRSGPSTYYEDCSQAPGYRAPATDAEPQPCWRGETLYDLFDVDGRYLGEVEFPPGYSPMGNAYIRDDLLLLVGEDDAGTIVVKHFRLIAPTSAAARR
jgi:hypothetical protein